MSPHPSRFSLALDFACAAITVMLSGYAADEVLRQEKKRKHLAKYKAIMPLEEEFSDLFESRKHFIHRLCKVAFTDLSHDDYSNLRIDTRRIRVLRRTALMPSDAIRALANAIGCQPADRANINLLLHRKTAYRVAREIGVSDEFLRVCWTTRTDLDAQWRTVRDELLNIRAEKRLAGVELL